MLAARHGRTGRERPMSPSVSRRRRSGRSRRPSRRRNRQPRRLAISAVFMSAISARMPAIRFVLVIAVAWSIATGTYFAFRDEVPTLPRPRCKSPMKTILLTCARRWTASSAGSFSTRKRSNSSSMACCSGRRHWNNAHRRSSAIDQPPNSMNPSPIVPPVAAEKDAALAHQ